MITDKTHIVLTSRDRFKLLEQTLNSLYANTPNDQFTLTIVDDNSKDFRTLKLLREYAQKPNCTLVSVVGGESSLAALKTFGASVSQLLYGPIDNLYFTDNDVYFMQGWLEDVQKLALFTDLDGFRLWGAQNHPYHQPISEGDGWKEYLALAGTSWFMRGSTFADFVARYSSCRGLGSGQSEDAMFCNLIRERGHRIAALDPPMVIDCGWTNTEGKPAPGYETRVAVPGVYHE